MSTPTGKIRRRPADDASPAGSLRLAAFLAGLDNYERRMPSDYRSATFSLDRVRFLLEEVGAPHRGLKTLHVAGTKGKGSTASFAAAILAASGYAVGLYTSPHLHRLTERIQFLDRRRALPISWGALESTLDRLEPAVTRLTHEQLWGPPTYFEALTVMAFLSFAEARVDFAVVEAGLGGRWDATNVLDPLAAVLTPISLDHTAILGRREDQIAREKSMIMKAGRPAVSAAQSPAARRVFEARAREERLFLLDASRLCRVERLTQDLRATTFHLQTPKRSYARLHLAAPGLFQVDNAVTAVLACEVVQEYGYDVPADAVRKALAQTKWPARFQVLSERPILIVDGAHNVHSMERLVESLQTLAPGRRLHLVFGASTDKDLRGMAGVFGPHCSRLLLTRSRAPRATPPEELLAQVGEVCAGVEISIWEEAEEAFEEAVRRAHPEDLVCVAGSLYLAGEALRWWERRTS